MRTRIGRAVAKATAPRVKLQVGAVGLDVFTSPHATAALDPLPPLLAAVDGAKTTVLVSAYALSSKPFAQALVAAHGRGVKVTVVMDATEYGQPSSLGPQLVSAGIDLRLWGSTWRLNHAKVVIVDGKWVELGSYNYTAQAEASNQEVAVVLTGTKVVKVLAPTLASAIMAAYNAGTAPPAPTPSST